MTKSMGRRDRWTLSVSKRKNKAQRSSTSIPGKGQIAKGPEQISEWNFVGYAVVPSVKLGATDTRDGWRSENPVQARAVEFMGFVQ